MEEIMKKLLLSSLLWALTLAVAVYAQDTGAKGAKVFVDDATFDYGLIPGGEVVSHSYFLHNKGTDSLKILKVQPGCGCTKAPLKKDVVAVGDSAEVELVFTSSKGSHGAVSKSATVTCNDSERSSFQISFKAQTYDNPDSLRPLALSVATINFDPQSKARETKLVVKNVSKDKVKMHLVSAPYGYLKVDVPDSEIKPGKEKEIKVKLDASVTDESLKKSFTFAVNDSAGTRYTIPVILAKAHEAVNIQPPPMKKTN